MQSTMGKSIPEGVHMKSGSIFMIMEMWHCINWNRAGKMAIFSIFVMRKVEIAACSMGV